MADTPFLIGIAGGSGSGKTALAGALAARLPAGRSVFLELDSYYRDRAGQDPETVNFDEPAAFDVGLLLQQVQAMAAGESIQKPVYDFNTHTRLDRTERLEPGRWILVEGLFALHWSEIRSALNLKLFIDAPPDTCLKRRLARDSRERGRSRASIVAQFRTTVRPMFDRYVEPTRQFADLILDGRKNLDDLAREVVSRLDFLLSS